MFDEYDKNEEEIVENEDTTGTDNDKKEEKKPLRFCYSCRRSEKETGKLLEMPGNMFVCPECMQKTMDLMKNQDFSNFGNWGFPPNVVIRGDLNNMDELMEELNKLTGMPMQPKVKLKPKKKPSEKKKDEEGEDKEEPKLSLKNIPAPHKIKEQLDQYVIGQDYAKKVISVAVYNHYKRVLSEESDVEIQKSNMLMIGPTGCGKTYIVKTLAKLLNVPLAIADATSLTEAGYIGDDIESVLSKLLAAADNDVEKAERGIVFIDEIDKIAKKKNTNSRDVSGEAVQQGLLKLLEGATVEVPVGATSKNAMVPLTPMDTTNILFICGGAFPDLENIIKERLLSKSTMGFGGDLKNRFDNDPKLISKVENEDLREFGMIPEFLGRLPIVFTLDGLNEDMLVSILKEPKNAIMKQYKRLLELDSVDLRFTDDALRCIAQKALKKNTGARALRAIIEEYMLDIMYEIPKDPNIGRVTITKEYIERTGGPLVEFRSELI